jgi:hypothetical protein
MQTTMLASEIANYSVFQLKNKVEPIRELTPEEQNDIMDIIRGAALHILRQDIDASTGT